MPSRAPRAKIDQDADELKAPPPRATPRGPSKRKDIATFVGACNDLVAAFPQSREGVLSEHEAEILTTGIDKAQQQSPGLQRFFKRAAETSGWLALAYAATVIALPRLARHNLIPKAVTDALGGMLGKNEPEDEPPAEPYTGPQSMPPHMSEGGATAFAPPAVRPLYAPGSGDPYEPGQFVGDGVDYTHRGGVVEDVHAHVASR